MPTWVLFLLEAFCAFWVGWIVNEIRRAKRVPRHKHIWGQWELKKDMKITYSGRPDLDYWCDLQQRECVGCGYIERERVAVTL